MRIMIITNHSYMLYQFRRELIASLLKEHEVIISTPFVGHEEDFKEMGCTVINTYVDRRGVNPFTDYKLLSTYASLIRTWSPDKVITYSIKPNIYAGIVCRFKHVPYYANVQGLGTAFQKKSLAKIVTFLYKFAFQKVRVVFFENEGNALEFQKRHIISLSKQKVLHGAGVNLDHYDYQPYPCDETIHFLFVGRIMKEKGVEELFDAMKKLHQEYQNHVILDVVGFFEDEYKDVVEELQQQGILQFHGFQQEVRPYYASSHCVVLPSYHEGMSNVLLEASASGRAIITSNIPGCQEAVDEGINGYLCHVKDSSSLYECMKKFMTLSYTQKEMMGKRGREKMDREFNKENIVKETIESVMEVNQ